MIFTGPALLNGVPVFLFMVRSVVLCLECVFHVFVLGDAWSMFFGETRACGMIFGFCSIIKRNVVLISMKDHISLFDVKECENLPIKQHEEAFSGTALPGGYEMKTHQTPWNIKRLCTLHKKF